MSQNEEDKEISSRLLWACFTIVLTVSVFCKIGKQFVKWIAFTIALFAIITISLNILAGGNNWGFPTEGTLSRINNRFVGGRLYEAAESSGIFNLTKDLFNVNVSWPQSGVSEQEAPPPEPEPEPEREHGWQYPWA